MTSSQEVFTNLSIYLCVTLTLSILTITQRHGVVTTMLVACAVCVWVVVGQGMKGGVKDVHVGGWGTLILAFINHS